MKTLTDAIYALLASGWTTVEIKSVLGTVPGLNSSNTNSKSSPWWTLLDSESYLDGTALVNEWSEWLEQKN